MPTQPTRRYEQQSWVHPYSGRVQRRSLLRLGLHGFLGIGLAQCLRLRAAEQTSRTQVKNCILIWLDGGPSHLDTFDPKPDASAEVRGPFNAIATKISGIYVGEHLSRTAGLCDRLAIIRSVTSPLGEHGLAHHYLLTGYPPSPVLSYPSFGSVVAHVNSPSVPAALPPYIVLPESRTMGSGFLGLGSEPFIAGGDPAQSGFRVRDLDYFPGVDDRRVSRRREFLRELDSMQAEIESADLGADTAFERAYCLTTSPEAKRAFDLTEESMELRDRYGRKTFGQSCLLARRLVQRGVPFVTVTSLGWDTHADMVLQLRDGYSGAQQGVGLIPSFDLGFSALVEDLHRTGLLDETLVVVMGEFGRTPKLNTRGGRDHWPRVFSVVMCGGGIRGGQVVGSSDRLGESPQDNPVTPSDLARTLYTCLGVDPDRELFTPDGRPILVNQGGKLIRGLI
jgi:uncharacterized protein (DUF1501 family)